MIVRALGISMGTHERTEEAKQSSTTDADARINLADLNGSSAFDSAQVLLERSGKTNIDAAKMELTGSEELQILKENVVQARVDLAALKASVDGGNRNGNAQLSKMTERIERMERNQAEPAARLSKAAENLERIARAETTGTIVPPQP